MHGAWPSRNPTSSRTRLRSPSVEPAPLLDDPVEVEAEEEDEPDNAKSDGGGAGGLGRPAQALRPPARQRPAADAVRGARARPPQGHGRRGGEEAADRVEPPARDVDHAQLHEGRRPAPRPDPGGEHGADPGGREVRLPARLQALDLRDLVDPAVDLARARRPGPDDPAARCTWATRCARCSATAAR